MRVMLTPWRDERREQVQQHARVLPSRRADTSTDVLSLAARREQLAADDDEPRRVVVAILDGVEQDPQVVDLGRGFAGESRRAVLVARAARRFRVARDGHLLDVRQDAARASRGIARAIADARRRA